MPSPDGRSDAGSSQAAPAAAASETAFKTQLVALIPQMRAFARSLTGNATAADDLAHHAAVIDHKTGSHHGPRPLSKSALCSPYG
jgi:hypothetical protein